MKRGLLGSSAVFGGMTLLSRLAGFVRDILQASLFGASAAMDAFVIAYRIPNYLRRIFAEGSDFGLVDIVTQMQEEVNSVLASSISISVEVAIWIVAA